MKDTKSKKSFILWGAVIGGSLGLMESAIAIRLWRYLDSPDFLVRPHQTGIHAFMNTVAGIVVGLIFGIILLGMTNRKNLTVSPSTLYIILILLGAVVYIPLYWVILKFQIPLWFIGDIILFIGGLVLARLFMKKLNT